MARLADGGLSRPEWLAILVIISVRRFVDPGLVRDVSEALDKLLDEVLQPATAPTVLEVKNEMRRACCYHEKVVNAIVPSLPTMIALYTHFSARQKGSGGGKRGDKLMSASEWVGFCEAMLPGECTATYLSERDLQRVFLKSRTHCIDPIHGNRRLRFRNLTFEDFVEAVIRVSMLAPLPTAEDLDEWGVSNAVEWYKELLDDAENADAWDDVCDAARAQREQWQRPEQLPSNTKDVAHRLKHLLAFIESRAERHI